MLESKLQWGAETPEERAPVLLKIHRDQNNGEYNGVGFDGGLWSFQSRMVGPFGIGDLNHKPDFEHTESISQLPKLTSQEAARIATFDQYGANVRGNFLPYIQAGYRLAPTGAINHRSTFYNPQIVQWMNERKYDLEPDGKILEPNGRYHVSQVTLDQAWHLEGVARRLGMTEFEFRKQVYDAMGGEMFPSLLDDEQVKVLVPPMGGVNISIFGDMKKLGDPKVPLTLRLHDFCHDGDAGACRCSCRIYRDYAALKCIQQAQRGGLGIMVEGLDEGTGQGSTKKHLVYEYRANHPDGDRDDHYYTAREKLTGCRDGRMPWTKLNALHMLAIRRPIDEWVSMSRDKTRDLYGEGFTYVDQIDLPPELQDPSFIVEFRAKNGDFYAKNGDGSAAHSNGHGKSPNAGDGI